MSALQQLCSAAFDRPSGQPAIEFEGRWFTWGELRALSERLHALLDGSGIPRGAAVAFVPRNRPSAIAALLTLLSRGHWVRMLYAFQSGPALARDVDRLKPAVVIAAAEDFSAELSDVMRTQGIAGFALQTADVCAIAGLEQVQRSDAAHTQDEHIEILTSGTTGPPKQFAVRYDMLAQSLVGADAQGRIPDLSGAQPTLLFFPLGNISGLYSSLPAVLKGQRAVLLERFSVAGWHDFVLRYRPEASGMPPAGVQMVLDANIPREDLACIKRFGTGAAPLDPTVQRAFEERYGIPILLSYGATEFGGPVTAMTPELHAKWGQKKFGSVGKPLPGAQIRVIDAETGAVLPPGQEGLLEVISPRIGPHWIRTSDVAMIDEEGFLFHRGRADGAIMRGGFKLLPETIERALLLHPAVSAAAVLGVPDPRLGEVPAAAVQLKPRAIASFAELEAHLRNHIYATHIPVHWRLVDALPRTLSMKVDRPALKQLFSI